MDTTIKSYDEYIQEKVNKTVLGNHQDIRMAAQYEKDANFLYALYEKMNNPGRGRILESIAEDIKGLIADNFHKRIHQLTPEELKVVKQLDIEVRDNGEVVKLHELADEKKIKSIEEMLYEVDKEISPIFDIDDYLYNHRIFTINERVQLAKTTGISASLDILSCDVNEEVRAAVAGNQHTDTDILKILSKDESAKVRAGVAYNLYASNRPIDNQDIKDMVNNLIQDDANIAFDIDAYLKNRLNVHENDRYTLASMPALWTLNHQGSGSEVNRCVSDTRSLLINEAKTNSALRKIILENDTAYNFGRKYSDNNLTAIDRKEHENTKKMMQELKISDFHIEGGNIIASIDIKDSGYSIGETFYMADAQWTITGENMAFTESLNEANGKSVYGNNLAEWTTVCGINEMLPAESIYSAKHTSLETSLNDELDEIFGTMQAEASDAMRPVNIQPEQEKPYIVGIQYNNGTETRDEVVAKFETQVDAIAYMKESGDDIVSNYENQGYSHVTVYVGIDPVTDVGEQGDGDIEAGCIPTDLDEASL